MDLTGTSRYMISVKIGGVKFEMSFLNPYIFNPRTKVISRPIPKNVPIIQ